MAAKKSLNDHLFDTLDRLSSATEETLSTEMNKAASIISVSEQILNAARFKLEIIQANPTIIAQFGEIDNVATPAQIENEEDEFSSDKKKLKA